MVSAVVRAERTDADTDILSPSHWIGGSVWGGVLAAGAVVPSVAMAGASGAIESEVALCDETRASGGERGARTSRSSDRQQGG